MVAAAALGKQDHILLLERGPSLIRRLCRAVCVCLETQEYVRTDSEGSFCTTYIIFLRTKKVKRAGKENKPGAERD